MQRNVMISWTTWVIAVTGMAGCESKEEAAPADAAVDGPEVDATPIDARLIDAAIDGRPPGICDPLQPAGAQGCATGEKCTWLVVQGTPEPIGRLACVPDGPVGLGGECQAGVPGEATGYDDCAAGLYCIGGTCSDLCGFDGGTGAACATGFNCTRYADVFSNGDDDPIAGVCVIGCEPLTQLRTDGQPCGAGQGCYVLVGSTTTTAVCAPAGALGHGAVINGPAFANSCVPGAQPRRQSPSSTTVECGGLCRMTDVTSTLNTASEGGVAPDSCAARWGAPAPDDPVNGESCRYWWAREPFSGLSPFSNSLGWCFRHTAFQYDSNGDGAPDAAFPRCAELTTGDVLPPVSNPPVSDARYFWCAALPSMFTGGTGISHVRAREPRLDRLVAPSSR